MSGTIGPKNKALVRALPPLPTKGIWAVFQAAGGQDTVLKVQLQPVPVPDSLV